MKKSEHLCLIGCVLTHGWGCTRTQVGSHTTQAAIAFALAPPATNSVREGALPLDYRRTFFFYLLFLQACTLDVYEGS